MSTKRALTGGERSNTQGNRVSRYRLRVTNPDGEWLNLGALTVNGTVPKNFTQTAQLSAHIDDNTWQMTATVRREIGSLSLSPLKVDSRLNAGSDFTFRPAIDLRRLWIIEVSVLPQGVPVTADSYRPLAEGIITRLDINGEIDVGTITLAGRGQETPLLATEQLTEQQYPGAPILERLQAMLDRWNTGATAVAHSSAPSYFVNGTTTDSPQPVGPLMPALTEIAALPGAVFRYLYGADDVSRPTLFTPDRNASVPDWVLGPREYKAVPLASLDLDTVANYIQGTYYDEDLQQQVTIASPAPEPSTVTAAAGAATFSASPGTAIADGAIIVVAGVPYAVSGYTGGTTATLSGAPTFAAAEWVTSASITRYGLRPFVLTLAQMTHVTTFDAASMLLDAIRSDWEFPAVQWQIESEGTWFVFLYDFLELLPNATHNSESQFMGVTSVTYTFSGGKLMVLIGGRGKPSGGYRSWLSFGSNAPRVAPAPELSLAATWREVLVSSALVPGVFGTATVNQYTRSVKFELSATVDFAVVIATNSVDVTDGTAEYGWVGSGFVTPGTVYYVRATPYSGPLSGGTPTGVAGAPDIKPTYVDRLRPTKPQFDTLDATVTGLTSTKADVSYVDAKVAGLSWKQAVRAATTAAGTLASSFENGDAIDGVVLATGDRILIKNQATASENGIYTVNASGAPTRATDADAGAELVNATCYVSEGTANADTQWTCTTNAPITLGSTSLAFAQLSTGGSSPAATTATITTASLADGATETGTVTVAKSALMQKIVASAACWLRLYETSAARTSDASRAITTSPKAGLGILSNAAPGLDSAGLTIPITPAHELHNGDGPRTSTIYYALTNKSGSTAAITATLTVLPTET